MSAFLRAQLDYIFLVYGLAFVLLAVLCAQLRRRGGPGRPAWGWLGLFGLVHGLNEWLDMLALSLPDGPGFTLARTIVMGVSFVALVEFGRRLLPRRQGLGAALALHGALLGLALTGLFWGPGGLSASCRYSLGLCGGLMSGWGLWRQREGEGGASRLGYRLAGGALLVYAVVAGLVPGACPMPPARWVNHETFLAWAGFPVQLIRAACAVAVMWGAWLACGVRPVEQPTVLDRRWLAPVTLGAVLLSGWLAVHWRSSVCDCEMRQGLLNQAMQVAQMVDPEQIGNLTFTQADLQEPYFKVLREQMVSYALSLRHRSLYSLVRRGDDFYFGPESLDPSDPQASPPGTRYSRPPAALDEAFRRREGVAAGPYSDEYGSFISAFAPVLHPRTRETLMVVGMDLDVADWHVRLAAWRRTPILFTLGILLSLLTAFRLLRWRSILPREGHPHLPHLEAWTTALCGLALTVGGSLFAHDRESRLRHEMLKQLGQAHQETLRHAISVLRDRLASLAQLYQSSQQVTQNEFESFVQPLMESVAVEALAYARRARPGETPASERMVLAHDLAALTRGARPEGPSTMREAPGLAFPIVHLSPPSWRMRLLGLDLACCRHCGAAIEQAARTGLVQALGGRGEDGCILTGQDLLILHPVYPAQAARREDNLEGLVVAVCRLQAVMDWALSRSDWEAEMLQVDLVDLAGPGEPSLLARHGRGGKGERILFPACQFGCSWGLRAQAGPGFAQAYPRQMGLAIGACGLLLTTMLTLLVGFLCNRQMALKLQVRERTKALSEALDRAEKLAHRAEASDAAKSQFLANMSHEIRTPMTAILGFADLIEQTMAEKAPCRHEAECTFPETAREHLHIIRRNGQHLLGLINDILDLSKIESGKLVVEQAPTDLVRLVEEVASLMRVRAAQNGLQLLVEHEFPLPRAIVSDPARVRQILLNLVGNAIKFTQAGQVRIVSRRPGQGRLSIDVCDTGIGITPDQQARLFQPFAQADTSMSRQFGGTGLGLVISRRLAQALGGEIRLSSRIGEGSVFTLVLPCREVEPGQMRSHPNVRTALRMPACDCLAGRRILVAEDGLDNQALLSAILRKAGAQIDLAANGRVALEMALAARAEGRPHDLILMDMQMPEMDGYQASAALRQAGFDRPIVALTAHAMTGSREKCLQAGCTDYLTKPIDRADLLAAAIRLMSAGPSPNAPSATA